MVFKDTIHHVVVNFSKFALEINQGYYKCSLIFFAFLMRCLMWGVCSIVPVTFGVKPFWMLFSAYPFYDKNSKILFLMDDVTTFRAIHWSIIGRKWDGSSVVWLFSMCLESSSPFMLVISFQSGMSLGKVKVLKQFPRFDPGSIETRMYSFSV